MGLGYDTTSAQVIQVVKIGCKSIYHSLRSILFEPLCDSFSP